MVVLMLTNKNMNLKNTFFTLIISMICVMSYSQDRKVAVVTFYADKTIDLSQVSPTADFIARNTELSESESFNLKEPLKKFHNEFFENYVKNFPFEVLEEKEVTNNENYKAYTPDYKKDLLPHVEALFETIDGYKVLRQTKTVVEDLTAMADKLGVDGIMFVYLNFDFNKTGVGKFGYFSIRAHVEIDLYDKKGKSVFLFNELAGSTKKAVMVGGIPVMSPDKIQPMCESAIENLMEDLDKKIERLSKKVDRKF